MKNKSNFWMIMMSILAAIAFILFAQNDSAFSDKYDLRKAHLVLGAVFTAGAVFSLYKLATVSTVGGRDA